MKNKIRTYANFLVIRKRLCAPYANHLGSAPDFSQVLHQDCWVDVTPIPGALIINVGDFLEVISLMHNLSIRDMIVQKKV